MSRKMRTAPPPHFLQDAALLPRWQWNTRGSRRGSRQGSRVPRASWNPHDLMKVPLKRAFWAAAVNTDAIREERERWRPRGPFQELQTKVFCSSGGLTVINESLNVGKHFISASSVFIRKGQPLAGRERAGTFITATRRGEGEGPPIGLIKTAA